LHETCGDEVPSPKGILGNQIISSPASETTETTSMQHGRGSKPEPRDRSACRNVGDSILSLPANHSFCAFLESSRKRMIPCPE